MRGCSGFYDAIRFGEVVFPAYAGMFLYTSKPFLPPNRFPRVCGDVP